MERWKTIEGFLNYEVSTEGRVRNSRTGYILSTQIDRDGCEVVQLYKNGIKYYRRVGRLVAEAFIDRRHDRPYVSYKNGDRLKNSADNLEWSNLREIIQRHKSEGRKYHYKTKRVLVVETGEIFDSVTECSRSLDVCRSTISKCLNNPYLSSREGYHFQQID